MPAETSAGHLWQLLPAGESADGTCHRFLLREKKREKKMKKKKVMLAAAVMMLALCGTACGKKDDSKNQETAASASDLASPSQLTEDDAGIKELEATEVPDAPDVSAMGKITLPDLTTIEVSASARKQVTDEDIQNQIDYVLSSHLEEVDGAAQKGDTVNIDYEGKMNGETFDGGSAKGYDLELGSNTFIDGFEDQLVGHKKGDTVSVNVTFPEDYSSQDLAGKPAVFTVTVNSVSRKPELTDDWVKNSSGTNCTTVDEFKQYERELLDAYYQDNYDQEVQQNALEEVLDTATIEPSDVLMDYANKYVTSSQISSIQQSGRTLSALLNSYNMTVDDFKKEMEQEAEDFAKQYFVVHKIADDQNITATDEVLNSFADRLSKLSGQELNRVKLIERYGKTMVYEEAVTQAALEYMESQVKVTTTEETTAAQTSAAEETESSGSETEDSKDASKSGKTKTIQEASSKEETKSLETISMG